MLAVALLLVSLIMSDRSNGVLVFSNVRRPCGSQGVRVLIQSDREPKYLDARIEKFMHSMRYFIKDIAKDEFYLLLGTQNIIYIN